MNSPQRCLTRHYHDTLLASLNHPSQVSLYNNPTFEVDETQLLDTPIAIREKLPRLLRKDGTAPLTDDAKNAILVHKYLKDLRPHQAADGRLWAYMTHTDFFSYTKARWPGTRGKNARRNIANHYFLRGGRQGLIQNSVARLWWGAHLTHAPWESDPQLMPLADKFTDPYEYTRIFFYRQEVFQGLMARRFGSSLLVRICTLEALRVLKEDGLTRLADTAKIMSKTLNLLSSYRVLSALPYELLMPMMLEHAKRARSVLEKRDLAQPQRSPTHGAI